MSTVTLNQIAELAGVSRGTVDRSLNNRGGIKPDVDHRIKEIAKRLGYRPNRAGKALASRKNPPKFGISLNSLGNPFFQDVIKGIKAAESELSDFGTRIIIKETKGYNIQNQINALDELAALSVNSIAVMPIDHQKIREKINTFSKSIPIFTINTDINETSRIAYVGCDYLKSGETAGGIVNLLINDVCNVGIITGSVNNMGHNMRMRGFLSVLLKDSKNIDILDIIENDDDDIISYSKTLQMLKNNPTINFIYIIGAGVNGTMRAVEELKRSD
ncbi:MAG: LacI family DNA-binding transcriptional regulator, partial [Clostridia bacterium]